MLSELHSYPLCMSESQVKVFLLLILVKLANNADPDEISRYLTIHMGLHHLMKYLLINFKSTMGKTNIQAWSYDLS